MVVNRIIGKRIDIEHYLFIAENKSYITAAA